MAEDPTDMTEYERLSIELAKLPDSTEFMARAIQDGIELEDFRKTRQGQIMIGRALKYAKAAIAIIVDPNATKEDVGRSVVELRIQHRVLMSFEDTISAGRQMNRQINQEDAPDNIPVEVDL